VRLKPNVNEIRIIMLLGHGALAPYIGERLKSSRLKKSLILGIGLKPSLPISFKKV